MTDRELVSVIQSHRADSLGNQDGDLSAKRVDAMDHYHGRPYGNEVVGRSQVVSRDLAETVDWIMPPLMRVFVQSAKLGEFDPVGPEDEQLAQQESDYVNRVMMQENPGFMVLHDAIKDALLLKNGYTKELWEESTEIKTEEYEGLSPEQLMMLQDELTKEGAEVEIIGSEVKETEYGPTFDVELKITKKCGKATWVAIPAEEIRVSTKCRGSLRESPFVEHVTRKTRSELIEMGLPADFVETLPAYDDRKTDSESLARDSVDDESDRMDSVIDRSMDLVEYCEAYVRVDYDGDGIAELRKVVTCADRIPPGKEWNEPVEECAITGWVTKRVPHRHVGESLDDEIADIQEIKTTLQRQMLDNAYFTNTSQIVVNTDVHLPDFLTNQPGGVKRTKNNAPVGNSVMAMNVPPIIPHLLPAIDYIDKVKEIRSGVRPGSDMDPDMLQQVTKGAYMEHINRASQKIEMIARMIAETGVKEAFLKMHAILIRHQNQAKMVQLRGKWVPINPAEWRKRTDLNVRIGLGTGNEEDKRAKLSQLAQAQFQLSQAATQAPPPIYAKLYAMFEELCGAMGLDNPEKYAIAPNSPEYAQMQQMLAQQKQGPNPELLKEQAKGQVTLQVEAQRNQLQVQSKQAELQVQAANDARDAEREERRMQSEFQLEQMRIAAEQQKMEKEYEFRRWQAELDAAVKLQQSSMQSQMQNQATAAAEREVVEEVKPEGPDSNTILATALQGLNEALGQMRQPRTIIRGPDGRAEGIA